MASDEASERENETKEQSDEDDVIMLRSDGDADSAEETVKGERCCYCYRWWWWCCSGWCWCYCCVYNGTFDICIIIKNASLLNEWDFIFVALSNSRTCHHVCLPAFLPVGLPESLSAWLSAWLFACLSVCLPTRLPAYFLLSFTRSEEYLLLSYPILPRFVMLFVYSLRRKIRRCNAKRMDPKENGIWM